MVAPTTSPRDWSTRLSQHCKHTIALVGMSGAGKSTIGKRLAQKMDIAFVDADDEIVEAAGMSIPEIFDQHGEDYFRSGETRVVQRLLESGPQIMATGGGAFCQPDTAQHIKDKAVTVWLKADLDTIFARVSRNKNRPLLNTPNPKQKIKDMLDQRNPLYARADITIPSDQNAHEATVNAVIEALDQFFTS